jgi:ferric-dicitrate binding protein FerR (iron transport regulator)
VFLTPTDFDIVLAARSMIRVYDGDAAAEAARRAAADLQKADAASGSAWQRIMAAIEKLQAEKLEPGERCSNDP